MFSFMEASIRHILPGFRMGAYGEEIYRLAMVPVCNGAPEHLQALGIALQQELPLFLVKGRAQRNSNNSILVSSWSVELFALKGSHF